ncbi:hypothetical protein [Streptomyces sp. SID8352]|uniref:hypothetical protein n=1 Tax=Streptomyces sp. SID8352 TaxID=2690338 RepID=UPI00136A4750|nr:hypothetical protein [Streptomyces sp. SID8352]MYU24622.1 hypothetical protein [Streptomyces sp. SID8352]
MPSGTVGEGRFGEFRDLHAEGLGRNAIARAMKISQVVASRTAEHLGLTFDRSRIQAAAEARKADIEERRSLLAARFLDVAEESLDRVDEPTTVYAFGGKNNEYNEHVFDQAPIAERQKLVTTAAIAVDKSLKLVPAETSGSGADDAKSMLGKLAQGIAAIVNEGEPAPEGALDE